MDYWKEMKFCDSVDWPQTGLHFVRYENQYDGYDWSLEAFVSMMLIRCLIRYQIRIQTVRYYTFPNL
jgi:hypothetical protein